MDSSRSRRAHRIQNLLQQEGKTNVKLGEDFLDRLSTLKGKGTQIKSSILAAEQNAHNLDGLDSRDLDGWERSFGKSQTGKYESSQESAVGACVTCGVSKFQVQKLDKAKRDY